MTTTTLNPAVLDPSSTLLARALATDDRLGPVLARVTLAVVMLPHGLQKTLGWFGGYGFEGTIGFLTGSIGLPWLVAAGLILVESLGAALLLAGVASRLLAAAFTGIMLGAVVTVHASHGFFMNWSGQQAGEGFEYHLLAIGLALVVLLQGGGRWSVDRRLASRMAQS